MEALSQIPFRNLTKLYSATKQSCDVVIDQEKREDAPELASLHRKFRIQKNRLIAWGCEWSDTTNAGGVIDESVAKAGLTETVTSVLGTIKEVLDEAERIRCSDALPTKPSLTGKSEPVTCDRPWSVADRARYEDLANDLTNSIDILYDLSRSRRVAFGRSSNIAYLEEPARTHISSALEKQKAFVAEEYNFSDLTLINPSTTSTLVEGNTSPEIARPKKLNRSDLDLPEEEPPPYSIGGPFPSASGLHSSAPFIGHISSSHALASPWHDSGSKPLTVPVLVEYAYFDSAYSDTGVPPPLSRLESLMSILCLQNNSGDGIHGGLLNCIGYFEDHSHHRFGIVYELPSTVLSSPSDANKKPEELRPVSLLSVLQAASRSVHVPNPASQLSIPPLEDRYRLAYNVVSNFSKIHGEGFFHKDVNSAKVMLFPKSGADSTSNPSPRVDLRSPYVCSFDVFSEYKVDKRLTPTNQNIYMHPQDPRTGAAHSRRYSYQHDMYGLALILIEIALWLPLSDIFKPKYSLMDFQVRLEDIWIKRLASKCGTPYMRAVEECFTAATRGSSSVNDVEEPPRQLYRRLLSHLQRCCLLDDNDPIEEDRSSLHSIHSSQETLKQKTHELSTRLSSLHHKAKSSASVFKLNSPGKKHPPPPPPPRTRAMAASTPNIRLGHESHSNSSTADASIANQSRRRSVTPRNASVDGAQSESADQSTPVQSSEGRSGLHEAPDEAASIIQRAWRRQHASVKSFKDYRQKIVIIQQHWRNRKPKLSPVSETFELAKERQHSATTAPGTTKPPAVEPSPYTLPMIDVGVRKKTRLQPLKLDQANLDRWHHTMLPRLERLVSKALKDSDESISIDLVAMGDSPITARPTILVTCSSTTRVKSTLSRKFPYDSTTFDMKVRKGKIRRSKAAASKRYKKYPRRSNVDSDSPLPALNPYYQQRPLCGASIGAFRGEHYPPASFGGVVIIDDKPFGCTVHHLLDEPSDAEDDDGSEPNEDDIASRTSAFSTELSTSNTSDPRDVASFHDDGIHFEISDDEEEDSDGGVSEIGSNYDFDDDAASENGTERSNASTCGDVGGVDAENGEDIIITQPALDDVQDDFFPSEEDKDEDHIDSHSLGHVHASSGLRRWTRNGIVHEIDWALLKLKEDRLQPYNIVQGGRRFANNCNTTYNPSLVEPVTRQGYSVDEDEYPVKVANSEELGGLRVHCFGRTTGLRSGMVGPAMSAVRVRMRRSFSRSWHVLGALGMPGDSGSWAVDDRSRVCGHVLARCERFHIAYICPFDVLLEDMKRTLGASSVSLPGAADVPSPVEQIQPALDRSFLSRMGSVGLSNGGISGEFQASPPKRMIAHRNSQPPARMDIVGSSQTILDYA